MSGDVTGKQVRDFVEKKILQLHTQMEGSSLRSTLAQLRRGVGKMPGEIPELWGFFLDGIPEEMMGRCDPSRAEWAIYAALTLFALHQQGRDTEREWMSQKGNGFGQAVAKLIHSEEDRGRVTRRFHAVATASHMKELSHHMRGIVQMLRSESISIDYPSLAEDLYWYQIPKTTAQVRLHWGQDFYRRPVVENKEDISHESK